MRPVSSESPFIKRLSRDYIPVISLHLTVCLVMVGSGHLLSLPRKKAQCPEAFTDDLGTANFKATYYNIIQVKNISRNIFKK